MPPRSRIICKGITKTYEQYALPTHHLQDHIVRWKRHRQKKKIEALNNVSFAVKRGEWLGIYGPNGSGKTTLLQIVAGLLPPDSGKVICRGRISCFFTLGVGFHDEKGAEENIYLHGLLHGMHPQQIKRITPEILRFAEVDSHVDLPLKCYSTGMRSRLAYAAAAHIDSDIFLFDEVLAVGDEHFRKKCIHHMRSLRERGKTVILVNHSEEQLEQFCDRILYLQEGKKVQVRSKLWDYGEFAEQMRMNMRSIRRQCKYSCRTLCSLQPEASTAKKSVLVAR